MGWSILARPEHPNVLLAVTSRWERVRFPIVWQFIDYMDSRTTFTMCSRNGTTCIPVYKLNVHHVVCVSLCMRHLKWMLCVCVIQLFIIDLFFLCLLWVLNVCEVYLTSHLFVLFVFGPNANLATLQGHDDDVGGEARPCLLYFFF